MGEGVALSHSLGCDSAGNNPNSASDGGGILSSPWSSCFYLRSKGRGGPGTLIMEQLPIQEPTVQTLAVPLQITSSLITWDF